MENHMQNPHNENDIVEIDVMRMGRVILKNIWKIAIVAILCGSIALFVSYQFITPMYRTSTSFYVANKLQLYGVDTNISSGDLATSSDLVHSYIELLKSRHHLTEAINHSGLNLTYGQLSGMITTTAVKETGVFKVTVSSPNRHEAAQIAESIAYIVETQICEILRGSSVKMIDKPIVPTAPYSPNHAKNTMLGFVVGFLISAGLIVLLEIFDSKLKSEDDLKHCCKYPILTVVPDMNASSKRGYYKKHYGHYAQTQLSASDSNSNFGLFGKDLDFATSEAYKLLRTKLQYSIPDSQACQVFVVSSAIPGEGKSVSSINLAYSLSQLGKRVLLIDADMRRPSLASKLAISNYPGLSEYLTGFMGLNELLQDYDDGTENSFKILTAGSIPPNPIELIDSKKMAQGIEQLRKEFDYIILDTPPVGDVSDALVASKYANGVLLVSRHNYCTRAALRDAVMQFEFVNSKILGSVFNCYGDKASKYNYKQYAGYYSHRQRDTQISSEQNYESDNKTVEQVQ